MASLEVQRSENDAEECLRGAALGSRDAEIYDGHVHKTEESLGSIGAGQIITSYDVEEPSPKEGRSTALPHSAKEKQGEDREPPLEVTRETGNLKLSYTTDNDVQPHRSTFQKLRDKITDKKAGLDLGGYESKPGLLTRLKHKVWNSDRAAETVDRKPEPHDAASDIEASSGSDTSLSTDSSVSDKLFISSGHQEEHIREQTPNIREVMATPPGTPSLEKGALPSSELGTGYEEDSESSLRQQPLNPAPAHGKPKWSPYTEDVAPKPPAAADTSPAVSTGVAQDRLQFKEEIPPLEEVKAPGLMDRLKEEVAAIGETVQEKVGLKDDSKDTLVPDCTKDQETGILERIAKSVGLQGSDNSHGRSKST